MKMLAHGEIRIQVEEENSPPPPQEISSTITTTAATRRLAMTDFSIDAILGNCANATTTSNNTTTYDDNNSNHSNLITSTILAHTLTPPTPTQPSTVAVGPTGKRPRPKKYKCPYCWVALSNTGQFRGHIRIHTGERPFKCDQPFCMKTFTRNEELTRHKRIHTGQRPYACDLCKKCFGRKDHLKKHMRTHERHALDLIKQSGQACDDYSAAMGTLEQLAGSERAAQELKAAYWSLAAPNRFSL